MTETAPYENPLIPNKRMQQMFVAMSEMRVLDEHIAALQHRVKSRRQLNSTRNQEAARVSTAIELVRGDLLSDAQAGVAMDLLGGAKVDLLLRRVADFTSGAKRPWVTSGEAVQQLPWVENVEDRLQIAIGAALALKIMNKANIVIAYASHGEVSSGLWRRVLTLAARLELPVIFVVLPWSLEKKKRRRAGKSLTAKSRAHGVPAIPVDASDAVALYRVAQESIARTRAAGGPVLVECVQGQASAAEMDPLVQMRSFLLGRKVCTDQWLDSAGNGLRKRLHAAKS